jgi:hypothetical protein
MVAKGIPVTTAAITDEKETPWTSCSLTGPEDLLKKVDFHQTPNKALRSINMSLVLKFTYKKSA